MVRTSFIVKLLFGIALFGALGGAAGFRFAGIDDSSGALPFTAEWTDVSLPTDYSGSRDRIEYELASIGLFGPARGARDGADGENAETGSESPLTLIAILSLDGTDYVLLEETPGTLERLRPGQSLESGWALSSIDPSSVRMRRGDEERVLALFPDRDRTSPGRAPE